MKFFKNRLEFSREDCDPAHMIALFS